MLYVNDGATLSQVLGEAFSSANDYSLSVDFGWRNDAGYPTEPEFRAELWAGGTRLGFVDQGDANATKGEFANVTLSIDGSVFSASGLDGQSLEVRLVGVSTQSNFDNIVLKNGLRRQMPVLRRP